MNLLLILCIVLVKADDWKARHVNDMMFTKYKFKSDRDLALNNVLTYLKASLKNDDLDWHDENGYYHIGVNISHIHIKSNLYKFDSTADMLNCLQIDAQTWKLERIVECNISSLQDKTFFILLPNTLTFSTIYVKPSVVTIILWIMTALIIVVFCIVNCIAARKYLQKDESHTSLNF
jgi:hypothetical protein